MRFHPKNDQIKSIDKQRIICRFFISSILILHFIIATKNDVHAQRTKTSQRAGELRKAEKGLKDNRFYFEFLDSSITNFGTEKEKKLFKEATQRDIIAQLLFMKFLFHQSFLEVRKSQNILINLYQKTLKMDISKTRKLLNELAPYVIESKNKSAIHYLGLGYRDVKVSRIFYKMADNYKESLYSLRLYKYVRAIKKAKHGKRYAFLAMIEAKATPEEKKEFILNPDFEELKKRITKYSPQEKREYYNLVHLDNYYLSKGNKSYYDTLWEKPDIHEIKDYQKYLDEEETYLPDDVYQK